MLTKHPLTNSIQYAEQRYYNFDIALARVSESNTIDNTLGIHY